MVYKIQFPIINSTTGLIYSSLKEGFNNMPLLPSLHLGTVLWANGMPARGIEVRMFDRDSASSDDDLTTNVGTSDANGEFSFWYDRSKAIDTVPISTDIQTWDFGDPFASPPRPPGLVNKKVTVQVPDVNDSLSTYLQFRYTLFEQEKRFNVNVVFGQNTYRLPHVGVGFRQNFAAVANGVNELLTLVHRQSRGDHPPRLWVTSQTTANGHGPWVSLDASLSSGTSIAIGRNQDDRLEIFARNSSGALIHCWQGAPGGTFGAWATLDGQMPPDAPITVATNTDGKMEVFIRGNDNAVWRRKQSSPNGGWDPWSSIGGNVAGAGDIAVAKNQDGRLELFAHAPDGTIQHSWQQSPSGAWSNWLPLQGDLLVTGPLAVARNQDGRLEVFAQGLDGAVWHNWQVTANGSWNGWSSRGGIWIGYGLLAGTNPDGRIEIFAHGMDGNLYHSWQQQPNGNWGPWNSLGRFVSPYMSIPPFGYEACLGRWSNGTLSAYQATYISNQPVALSQQEGGWIDWQVLEELEIPPVTPSGPVTPTLNSVTAGDAFLDVMWGAVAGATGYIVGFGTESAVSYPDVIDVGNVTTTRLSPLSNGTRYFVSVRAYNSADESPFSNQREGKPNGPLNGIADVVLEDEKFILQPFRNSVSADESFNIEFTLRNTGNSPTGPFTLRIERDTGSPSHEGRSFSNFPSLAPGALVTGIEFVPPLGSGVSGAPAYHQWKFFIGDRYFHLVQASF